MKRSDFPYQTALQAQRLFVAEKQGVPVTDFGRCAGEELPDDFPVPYDLVGDSYAKVRWQQRVNAYNNQNKSAY